MAKNSSYLFGCVAVINVYKMCFIERFTTNCAGIVLFYYLFIFFFLCNTIPVFERATACAISA